MSAGAATAMVTVDDVRRAYARIRDSILLSPCSHSETFSQLSGNTGLPQAGKPSDDRRLQGARRAQQDSGADPGGAGARIDCGLGRQPCAGRLLPRQQARHRRPDRDAAGHAAEQGDGHPPLRRRGGAATAPTTTRPATRPSAAPPNPASPSSTPSTTMR